MAELPAAHYGSSDTTAGGQAEADEATRADSGAPPAGRLPIPRAGRPPRL